MDIVGVAPSAGLPCDGAAAMSIQANPPFVLHQVPPASTDNNIDKWLSDHFVWLYPGAERGEKLFVHLPGGANPDRKSTRLNSSHGYISYAVFCLKKKKKKEDKY